MSDVKLTLKYLYADKNTVCGKCRNSNQGTSDKIDGLTFCKFGLGIKNEDYSCDVTCGDHLLFEEYDGDNCTWAIDGEFEVVREE